MNITKRNNIVVKGNGLRVMMFVHGFGCDQHMWRFITPAFEEQYKIILFDHVGAGGSDLSAFEPAKYETLEGYAGDILEIATELQLKDIIFIGHSVAAMMGIIAAEKCPGLFKSLILVAPSPCYINNGDYIGGFTKLQIEELLESLDQNHLGWSIKMAPVVMGNAHNKELVEELANSFCRTNPEIAKHFARTTFMSDNRALLCLINIPCLILQCTDDVIAPQEVGKYMNGQIKGSTFVQMEATGHCPNLSAPRETIDAIKKFLL